MIEQPRKIHFESLPFSPKLVYFKVKEASIPESSSDSNESNEEEYDRNNDAIEFLNENDFGGDLSLDNPKPNHPKRKKKTFVNLNEKKSKTENTCLEYSHYFGMYNPISVYPIFTN